MDNQKTSRGNRLAGEKSPYLLQHAHNPVDWYPWGEEPFARARAEDKPVFLSIGYATCHWCHVMAHESFEDRQVAGLINESFIPVKVDREERPDIDAVYMKASHLLAGRGGWPLTVLLTPEKEPFFAATYIPKQTDFPGTGLLDLIPRISRIWSEKRTMITTSAREILDRLRRMDPDSRGGMPPAGLLTRAAEDLAQDFDSRNGGFGSAPKFPAAHNLLFLLRVHARTGQRRYLDMTETTLQAMRAGGIFDHLGFGFHRYSTDRRWLVPHFEKMLYDQALISLGYLQAFTVTGKKGYAETAKEIFTYVLRDLTSPQGVFFSGEDADSEGEEGTFYLWSTAEIRDILSAGEAEAVIRAYNLKDGGNFKDEAGGRLTGKNILHLSRAGLKETAVGLGVPQERLQDLLARGRERLLAARQKRIRPQLDDKVLTDWNGLMIAALATGGMILERGEYTLAACRAADFILEYMSTPDGGLLHRYRDGEAGISGFLDDYVFLTQGLLDLFAATGRERYLEAASDLTRQMLAHFWDDERGGMFFTADSAETVLIRLREIADGALPSGNSVALMNMVRLIQAGKGNGLTQKAKEQIQAFSGIIQNHPARFTCFLSGLDQALEILSSG